MTEPTDCPECGSARSVERGLCQVCYAEFGETGAADLPPAASIPLDETVRARLDDAPLMFSDVIRELRAMVALAAAREPAGLEIAGRRAEAMVARLRRQFLQELGINLNAQRGTGAQDRSVPGAFTGRSPSVPGPVNSLP